MRISEFQIDQYGPLPSFRHSCDDGGLEVFYGPNESGKTLIIEAVLKLMAPDIGTVTTGVDRVTEAPTGYVMVDTPEGERKLGRDAALTDLDAISPHHLENVFVIRDSSLRIPGEHDYYDSVTEQIGDLHTAEIQSIRDRLVTEGNLTPNRLNLERSGSTKTAEVHAEATELLDDIESYVEHAEEEDIERAERRRLEVRRELRSAETRLEQLADARRLDEHATLQERLEEYRTATEELAEIEVSEEELAELRGLDDDIERLSGDVESATAEIESRRNRVQQLETELSELRAELEPLEARTEEVERLEASVEEYRAAEETALGTDSVLRPLTAGSLLGLALGGTAAVVGDAVLGSAFLVLGSLLGGLAYHRHRHRRAAERAEQRVLNQARDAGFDVASVDDIAPRIRRFRERRDEKRTRRSTLETDLEVRRERLEDAREERTTRQDQRADAREAKRTVLQRRGVDDVETYQTLVSQKERYESTGESAARSLADSFGTPSGDDPTPAEKIDYWRGELAALVEDIDTDVVSAADRDDQAYSELEARIHELESEAETLRTLLDEHNDRIADFNDRIAALSAQPYLDEPLSRTVATLDGLRDVRPRLEALVETIELSADVSREAIDVFDGLRVAEEQKIASLFEDGTAAEVFARVTDDRYTDVWYDADDQVLEVARDNGQVYTPTELSKGTTDQLYLATRLALARQLLSSDEGFFIMDDAFLPADDERLTECFDVLEDLASQGWQILYFTAKSEVGDRLATEFELPCKSLDSLP